MASGMHFGAAVRDVLSATYGTDLRHAKAHTLLPEPQSAHTLRLLAANLELAFGVAVPDGDLARLLTVRDVLQCVRLRRWVKRVEADAPAHGKAAAAEAPTPTSIAARAIDPREETFRFTRRSAPTPAAPLSDRPPARPGVKRF